MLPRGRKEALTQGAKRTQSEQGKNSQESRGAVEEIWQPWDFCLYFAEKESQRCWAGADLFLSHVSGGAMGGEPRLARRGEFFQRHEKAGSSAHRHTRRDLCLLVLAKERVRVCGAELHATRHQRRSGPRWLRWQDACIRGGQNTHGERGCACFAGA